MLSEFIICNYGENASLVSSCLWEKLYQVILETQGWSLFNTVMIC
jgi:hypothetical protein